MGMKIADVRALAEKYGIKYDRFDKISVLCGKIKEYHRENLMTNLSNLLYGDCASNDREGLLDLADNLGIAVNQNATNKEICLSLQKGYFTNYYLSRGEKSGLTFEQVNDYIMGAPLPRDFATLSALSRTFGNAFPELLEARTEEEMSKLLDFFRVQFWPMMLNENFADPETRRFTMQISPIRTITTPPRLLRQLEEFEEDVKTPEF